MGAKRGRGRGAFIDSVLGLVDTFYADVVQYLKAWSASPPRMREADAEPVKPSSLSSTSLSSQDGPESAGMPPNIPGRFSTNGHSLQEGDEQTTEGSDAAPPSGSPTPWWAERAPSSTD